MILDVLTVVGAVILVLLTVVLVHEGGHFLVGKLCGVRVDEFSVGFGPRIASKRVGETTYSLRVIPAGGFVRMAGMLGLEGEADAGERNFYRASIPKRMATILAGIVTNMVFAGLLFTILLTLPNASHIQPGAAAQQAGLHDGDVILSVDGRAIRHDTATDVATDLHAATAAAAGRPMTVVYASGGSTHTVTIRPSLIIVNGVQAPATATPSPGAPSPSPGSAPVQTVAELPVGAEFVVTAVNDQPVSTGDPAQVLGSGHAVRVTGFLINADGTRGASYSDLTASAIGDGSGAAGAVQAAWRLGVSPNYDGEPVGQALADGFGQIPTFVTTTFSDLSNLVTNPKSGGITGPQGLSGPVGIVRETVTATHQGGRSLAYWIAFVSMNLGLVNVLPIPFLDGGKAFLILLEAVRRRRLDPRREALIYAVGLAAVVLFAIYVTIGDVSRPQ
ncbi:MAG TPA: site-2 protease family protein [Candidatus Dormibacteraeota bacterium]|nr:site-2 protease family protein [Candidatus Dormibacteraeota bacterium]